MILFPRKKQQASGPESSPGGPAYDARIDPLVNEQSLSVAERLQAQTDIHHLHDKTAAAQVFSHAWQPSPSPLALQIMGLASQRDQIEQVVSRRQAAPFPGVELGHVPGFHAAPSPAPVLAGVHHLRFTAHDVESNARTRRRFGH